MYIEDRLFSENTEEVLYSILLDEDEYALYSEFQKEFGLAQGLEKLKKIKPKSVKKINKELKRKKLLERAPSEIYPKEEIINNPEVERAALRQARRDLGMKSSNKDFLHNYANWIVSHNKVAKSRLGSGLYVKNPDPLKEIDRRKSLKFVTGMIR